MSATDGNFKKKSGLVQCAAEVPMSHAEVLSQEARDTISARGHACTCTSAISRIGKTACLPKTRTVAMLELLSDLWLSLSSLHCTQVSGTSYAAPSAGNMSTHLMWVIHNYTQDKRCDVPHLDVEEPDHTPLAGARVVQVDVLEHCHRRVQVRMRGLPNR